MLVPVPVARYLRSISGFLLKTLSYSRVKHPTWTDVFEPKAWDKGMPARYEDWTCQSHDAFVFIHCGEDLRRQERRRCCKAQLTVFESAIDGLKKSALLGTHADGLGLCNGKEWRVKGSNVILQEVRMPDVDLGGCVR